MRLAQQLNTHQRFIFRVNCNLKQWKATARLQGLRVKKKKKVGRRRMYGTTTDAREPPTTRWHARDQGRLKLPRSHALKKEEKKKDGP